MNVYEEAHNLERAIRESDEYKRYIDAKNRIAEKPELKAMMDDFQHKQVEMQTKQILGQGDVSELMSEVTRLSAIVMQDPLANEYLQCQMRFSIMMKDVFDIINKLIGVEF